MNRLRGIKLKIERAYKHIGDLDAAIRQFAESEPYAIGAKPHPIAEIQHTALYVARADVVPDSIALITGDAIHNVRSALDHLAWQLVEAGGGVPNRATIFPINETPEGYAAALKRGRIQGMDPAAQKLIEEVQPYKTGDISANWTTLTSIGWSSLLLTLSMRGACPVSASGFPNPRYRSWPTMRS